MRGGSVGRPTALPHSSAPQLCPTAAGLTFQQVRGRAQAIFHGQLRREASGPAPHLPPKSCCGAAPSPTACLWGGPLPHTKPPKPGCGAASAPHEAVLRLSPTQSPAGGLVPPNCTLTPIYGAQCSPYPTSMGPKAPLTPSCGSQHPPKIHLWVPKHPQTPPQHSSAPHLWVLTPPRPTSLGPKASPDPHLWVPTPSKPPFWVLKHPQTPPTDLKTPRAPHLWVPTPPLPHICGSGSPRRCVPAGNSPCTRWCWGVSASAGTSPP